MNIHVYLSPSSPSITRIPQIKSMIRSRHGDATVLVTVDDGLHEDCCFIENGCDRMEYPDQNMLLESAGFEKVLAVA